MRDVVINVGIADYKLCNPSQKITTLGLGSCLGVVIYDPTTKICGLAHVMLPDSTRISRNENRKKFADTCLQDMYDELIKQSINRQRLVAKLAGGAKMFSHHSSTNIMNIGAQNYVAVCQKLAKLNVPVIAEDIGGTSSRTIVFDPQTQLLTIRGVNNREIQEYTI